MQKSLTNKIRKFFMFLLTSSSLLISLTVVSCGGTTTTKPPKTQTPSEPTKPTKPQPDPKPQPKPPVNNQPNPQPPTKPKNPEPQNPPVNNPPAPTPGTGPIPNFPGNFVPNLPSRTVPLTTSNLKPTSDNYFKNTTFTKPNEEELYQEIYDRSFGVSFTSKELWNETTQKFEDNGYISQKGTTWLFDYATNSEKTKFTLFFGTNLHVITTIGNTHGHNSEIAKNKTALFDYTDPTGNYSVGLTLGKPKQDPTSFAAIKNNTPHSSNTGGQSLRNFTSVTEVPNLGEDVSKLISKAPELVFAGFGYMKDDEYKQFDQIVDQKTKEYLQNASASEKESARYYWINDFNQKSKKTEMYKDFAIFKIDVDFTKATSQSENDFKAYILKAVAAVDKSIKRVKENIVPNHDSSSIPYIRYDYAGIQKNPDIDKNKNLKNYEYSHQYVDNVLVAGFPGSEGNQFWGRNNPKERYSDFPNKTLGHRNISATVEGGHGSLTSFLHRPLFENHGFKYSNLPYSSLYFGSSGSVGYNDYGLPIGIYSDVSLRVSSENDVSKFGSLSTFVQSSDITVNIGPDKMATMHAYDLIDGSDKARFPFQKTSYRENISLLFPQGLGSSKIMSTALFPNGYKVTKTS